MIFFLLKIVRFFVGLLVKVVSLPVKLVLKLLGAQQSDDEAFPSSDPDTGTASGAVASTDTETTAADGPLDVGAAQAKTNIERFRKGMLAVGALQLLLGLVSIYGLLQAQLTQLPAGLVGSVVGVSLLFALVPIVVGLKLRSYPSGLWYVGMGMCVLVAVGSLFELPGGLVGTAVYGALGYLGYTGRPALSTLGDGDPAGESRTETPHQPNTQGTAPADAGGETVPASDSNTASADTGTETSPAAGDRDTSPTGVPTESTAPATATDEERAADADAETDDGSAAPAEAADDAETAETAADGATATAEPDDADEDGDTAPAADAGSDTLEGYHDELTAPDPETRESAVADLAAATREDAVPSQAAIDALTERLDDDDAAVRAAACRALGDLGAERAKPTLKDLRLDTDPDVSRAASQALREIE